MKNCNSCGCQMQDDAVFCTECGTKIEESAVENVVEETVVEVAEQAEVNAQENDMVDTKDPYEASSLVETAEKIPVETVVAESVATPNYSYIPEDKVSSPGNKDGMCIAAVVLGGVSFVFSPIGICSILAIIFGAIGMNSASSKKNLATIGLILGCVTLVLQLIGDIIFTCFGLPFSFCC